MKTVLNLLNNKVMKNAIKYICALLLLTGVNVNAWGVTITLKVWNHDTGAYVDYGTIEKGQQPGSEPDNDGWNVPTAWAPGEQCDDVHPGNDYAAYHGNYAWPTSNYNGESTILYAVYYYEDEDHNDSQYYYTTKPTLSLFSSCTQYDITPDQTGTGTVLVDASACEDVVVTFTATPGTGYAYGGATILGDVTNISLATGDAKQFTMPGEDVILSVTFTAQSYDATLKPNGGSGSDQVVRVTYGEIPPTTLKVGGGAVVIPTRTGYDFDGYYDVSASTGGTQYYSYKGNPKTLKAEELWDKTNDANLFARWIAHTLTITLDKGTGGTNDGTAVVDYGTSALGDIDHATNSTTGYHLDGYYTLGGTKILEANGDFAADNITSYISDGNWIYDDDVTLYAHWALNTYTVHFNKNNNDATGSMSDQVFTYGTAQNLTSCGFSLAGKVFDGWATSAGGEKAYNNGAEVNNLTTTNEATVNLFAKWRDGSYTDYVFSCAELTLTPKLVTAGAPMFITSAAGKKVRSQDSILIVGSGLTPSTALTFPDLHAKFEIKSRTGAALATDASGAINAVAYIFYTPAVGDTDDGLDEIAGITVSVGGAKPKTASLTQIIIGRHLPTAGYVIAGKKDNKWYALPSNMASTTNPKPSEIAVNDINNPSVAYTATSNIYGLEGPTTSGSGNNISTGNGQYIRLTMSIDDGTLDPHAAPLFGSATGTRTIGKSGNSQASSHLSEGWWWQLKQTNTSITNPQDAKYTIYCANNTSTLSLRDNAGDPDWGLFASGVEELRLIPASDIVFTEAYFVEWAQHGGVVEVDAQGVAATSVVAHLNGASSDAITLVQTKAGDAKNKSSKYNYTVNFGGSIDFAAAASNGAMLTLEWKNGATTKAVSNIVVPKIIASNITINKTNYPLKSDWNTEVHVLPGKTVTIDADYSPNPDVTIKELNIYPGATVVASTGTLIATTLVLRNGWSRAGEKTYDVARLYVTPSTATLKATNVYADWYIDYDQYYPVAVPWNATVANFTYRYCTVAPTVGHDKNIRLRYYDGASRATNIQEGVGSGANWKLYGDAGCASVPGTLTPSTGYAMTAKRPSGKAFSIIRMPLTLPNGTWGDGTWTTSGESGEVGGTHKDQVAVTAHNTGSTPVYAQGWNFIANPYMALYGTKITHSEGSNDVTYVNIPDINFKEYGQYDLALGYKLLPSSGFFIQASKTGTLTFGTTNRSASAPTYRTEGSTPVVEEQKAYIVLNNENGEDVMGLKISENYTADYEINADLEKLLGDGTSLRTYMRYGDMNMAYVAINEMLAKEWIPVSVRIPADGEYTFSLHEASKVSELEGVYLIDYQNGDKVTNLIEQSYTFSSTAGTINGRFAINAKAGERQTPTGIDAINAGGDINSDKPFKFIYHDKVYIWINGIIYDTTGKRVK